MVRSRLASRLAWWLAGILVISSTVSELHARPRLRPVRMKDTDTLFNPQAGGLGTFPRLNNRNQVMFTLNIGGKFTAKLWDDGRLYTVGDQSGYPRVMARGLNDSGQVVGELEYQGSGYHLHGFVGTLQQIAPLPINAQAHIDTFCTGATVYDINEQGTASGWGSYALTPGYAFYRPVVWQGGNLIESGTIPAHPADSQDFHWPVLINNSGIIAGTVQLFYSGHFGQYHGYYGPPGAVTEVLPFPGGSTVYIWDINDQGVLAGQSEGSFGSSHAILVSGGQKKDIHGTVFAQNTYSVAYAVNDSGAAVGWWLGGRGLYYDNDTTWLIDSLLVRKTFPDGGNARLFEALDINNQGVVLALYEGPFGIPYTCLLVPADSGTIVNTDNDLPDLNPSDGRCYTGNVTALGEDECSLRAAIQHSNAHAGPDTVRFRIPVTGVPLIDVSTPLPPVTEEVYIDAVTQPLVQRVEVIPADNLVGGDGLVISAGRSTVRGLLINRFAGSGLVLTSGDNNRIERCNFGVRADSVTAAGNGLHGVLINASDSNHVGNGFDDDANLVSYNGGAGLFVAAGLGNLFSRNIIHHNGGLGIDLAPAGVNLNDTLDTDGGANSGVNYPTVDSATFAAGSTTLYGTLVAEPLVPYVVEISRSDTCDASGFGEGQEAVWSMLATTNSAGVVHFSTAFPGVLDPGQVFTLTATDPAKSTSEFSPCWPQKSLRLVDADGQPIANTWFRLSRVAADRPNFTETFVDSAKTDADGKIDIGYEMATGSLAVGDSIKVYKLLESIPKARNAAPYLATALSVHLDNAKFDSLTYRMSFDSLTVERVQTVRMTHTTLAVNLIVVVEWEADATYLANLGLCIRRMSNYLYDVMDGQLRMDTVWILNNRVHWNLADVRVHAANFPIPNALANGLFLVKANARIEFFRRWFGEVYATMDSTAIEWPMQPQAEINFRTLGHELAHYALWFMDEYERSGPPCAGPGHYGFMDKNDRQFGPPTSEMSWSRQYESTACRNTKQWNSWDLSCWDFFEVNWERSYQGVPAAIIRPDERGGMGSSDFFFGPNDNPSDPDHDVGSLVVLNIPSSGPRIGRDTLITAKERSTGKLLAHGEAKLFQAATGRIRTEGGTSRNGQIYYLGIRNGDSILIAGSMRLPLAQRQSAAGSATSGWLSGLQVIPGFALDSGFFELESVQGDHPMLAAIEASGGGPVIRLYYTNALPATPAYRYTSDADATSSGNLNDLSTLYEAALTPDSGSFGDVVIAAEDDTGHPFYFAIGFTQALQKAGDPPEMLFLEHDLARFESDSASNDRSVILSGCAFPPSTLGLPAGTVQLSAVLSVSSSDGGGFDSTASLLMGYNEADLSLASPPSNQEDRIHVFRWSSFPPGWEILPTFLDTAQNTASVRITQGAVYAAFTTDQSTDVEGASESTLRPREYTLGQNYPNPFNPSTTISYYLPQPGHVTLRIHNILGQTVRTLVDEFRLAGKHEAVWDGQTASSDMAGSGMYFYQLRVGDQVLTRRMVLIK